MDGTFGGRGVGEEGLEADEVALEKIASFLLDVSLPYHHFIREMMIKRGGL